MQHVAVCLLCRNRIFNAVPSPHPSHLFFLYVWGVEGKQVGSMDEEPQVGGCYNITFICTPTNQETVYWKRSKQTKHLEHESKCKV